MGNLYGTTLGGTSANNGTVFRLQLHSTAWKETILHTFGANDGALPDAPLTLDKTGKLYGTTQFGGSSHDGIVFELSPGANGVWQETILHTFIGGNDGQLPASNLIFDTAGNLYGVAEEGGSGNAGVVFEITP